MKFVYSNISRDRYVEIGTHCCNHLHSLILTLFVSCFCVFLYHDPYIALYKICFVLVSIIFNNYCMVCIVYCVSSRI